MCVSPFLLFLPSFPFLDCQMYELVVLPSAFVCPSSRHIFCPLSPLLITLLSISSSPLLSLSSFLTLHPCFFSLLLLVAWGSGCFHVPTCAHCVCVCVCVLSALLHILSQTHIYTPTFLPRETLPVWVISEFVVKQDSPRNLSVSLFSFKSVLLSELWLGWGEWGGFLQGAIVAVWFSRLWRSQTANLQRFQAQLTTRKPSIWHPQRSHIRGPFTSWCRE